MPDSKPREMIPPIPFVSSSSVARSTPPISMPNRFFPNLRIFSCSAAKPLREALVVRRHDDPRSRMLPQIPARDGFRHRHAFPCCGGVSIKRMSYACPSPFPETPVPAPPEIPPSASASTSVPARRPDTPRTTAAPAPAVPALSRSPASSSHRSSSNSSSTLSADTDPRTLDSIPASPAFPASRRSCRGSPRTPSPRSPAASLPSPRAPAPRPAAPVRRLPPSAAAALSQPLLSLPCRSRCLPAHHGEFMHPLR